MLRKSVFIYIIIIMLFYGRASFSAISSNPSPTIHSGPEYIDEDTILSDTISGYEIYEPENNTNSSSSYNQRPITAIISGVPRYYQTDIDDYLPGDQCGNATFYSGCGPVAGATILGWWDRRGFNSLIDDSNVEADGLPEYTIFELGKGKYMDRISACKAGTAVEPYNFSKGLRDYMDDNYKGYDFKVTKYKITTKTNGNVCYKKKVAGESESTCNTDMEGLWKIVKEQINRGQPMVYLLRSKGEQNDDGTFKFANHYVTVVGFDESGGDWNLIVQYNHKNSYQNVYKGNNKKILLTDHTKRSACIKYNLYTIEPGFNINNIYKGECSGLLVTNTTYHTGSYDGVSNDFEPSMYQSYDLNLSPTDNIILKDDICFVARWF